MKSSDLYAPLERISSGEIFPVATAFGGCSQKRLRIHEIFQLNDRVVQRAQWLSLGFVVEYEIGSIQGLNKPYRQHNHVMRENLGSLYFLWWLTETGTKLLMGLLLMISDTDLNVDTITVEEGRRAAGAHKVLLSSLGIFYKGKEPKKGHNRQLCESSITFHGIEAEIFILRKERKSWEKHFCTSFWTSVKRCLVRWKWPKP